MRNPKKKEKWSISSENEFGRLANEVNGRIKTQPTKSHSSEERKTQTISRKT